VTELDQTSPTDRSPWRPLRLLGLLLVSSLAVAGPRSDMSTLFAGLGDRPLWLTDDGRPTAQAFTLAAELDRIDDRGLDPAAFDAPGWSARLAELYADDVGDETLFRFEFDFSAALLRAVAQLHHGQVDPHRLGFALDPSAEPIDAAAVVAALARDPRPVQRLSQLEPQFPGHRRLRAALMQYRELAAQTDLIDLPPLPGRVLEPGSEWLGTTLLALRLHQLGDLPAADLAPYRTEQQAPYDAALVAAVERFQRRHGLLADGRIGTKTLAALETPLSRRVEQIRMALERWRWMPQPRGERRIVVNIPEFRLRAIGADGTVEFESDVVVGAAFDRQTPVFSDRLRHVVFQPSWHVPQSIVRRDLLPKALGDRYFLERLGYEVIGGGEPVEASPSALEELDAGRLRLRQKPGPQNSLGRVKFLFPNAHNVYLHDTPSTSLFGRARRDLSSGCVRVSDPEGLAVWVLQDDPDWPPERIREALGGGPHDRTVSVEPPTPVHLVYMTAVADAGGEVRFYDDIYGHDEALRRLLDKDVAGVALADAGR